MFRKFRARSAKWGRNGDGADESRDAVFFVSNTRCLFGNFPTVITREFMANRWLWKEFYENFSFKNYLPLKTSNVKGSNRHLRPTQTSLQSRDHCRQILSTQHCRPRARELPRSCQLFVWRTVSELWDVKVQFSHFGIFSPYQTPKSTSRWPAYSPGVRLQRRMPPVIQYSGARSKAVPFACGVFLRIL